MTRISVVIPCHNYGALLEDAVASVERQTRPADEVVIIDDGSTDETPEVVARLQARLPQLRAVRREPARGAARTFNDGVRHSTGELVVILSADDRLSDNYLECMEAALADPTVSFAYAGERMFGAVERWNPPLPFDRREVLRENLFNGSAMLRRELFDRVGGFREDFEAIGLEDWEFFVHCIEVGAVGVPVHECWLEYRRHEAGSRNTMPRGRVLRAHLKVWRLHPKVMGVSDILAWMARSVRRNVRRLALRT